MKSKLPVPTAKDINDEHRLARAAAETAVEHAVRCGQMLSQMKDSLPHGSFQDWIARKCDFSERTARVYMQAASRQNGSALPFSSLRAFIEVEKKQSGKQPDTTAPSVKGAVMNPPELAAQGSEAGNRNTPSGEEPGAREAARSPVREPMPIDDGAPEAPSEDELAAIDREIQESEAKVLRADDVTAGYHAELKRQAAEIAVLKVTRDGYMRGKEAVTKMLQAEQRKTARLEKEIARLREELRRQAA